jgi:hypothetical protein
MSEFNPKLGSFRSGTIAAVLGMVKYLLAPMLIFYLLSIVMKGMGTSETLEWSRIFVEMEMVTLMFAPMLVLFSFLSGFYPSGSYSRATFAILRVPILAVFGFSLLLDGRVQTALEGQGIDLDLVLLFYFFLAILALRMMRDVGELIDNRRDLLRLSALRLGTKEPMPEVLEDAKGHRLRHDLRLRYGRYVPGFKEAQRSLSRFIIWPMIIFMLITTVLANVAESSPVGFQLDLRSTSDILWMIGLPLVVLGFFKGFYPKGSVSRLAAWMAMVALIALWIWYFTLTGMVEATLVDMATIDLDYRAIVFLFIIAEALWALYALVEMISYRPDWKANNFRPVDEARSQKDRELRKVQRRLDRQRAKEEAKGKN